MKVENLTNYRILRMNDSLLILLLSKVEDRKRAKDLTIRNTAVRICCIDPFPGFGSRIVRVHTSQSDFISFLTTRQLCMYVRSTQRMKNGTTRFAFFNAAHFKYHLRNARQEEPVFGQNPKWFSSRFLGVQDDRGSVGSF